MPTIDRDQAKQLFQDRAAETGTSHLYNALIDQAYDLSDAIGITFVRATSSPGAGLNFMLPKWVPNSASKSAFSFYIANKGHHGIAELGISNRFFDVELWADLHASIRQFQQRTRLGMTGVPNRFQHGFAFRTIDDGRAAFSLVQHAFTRALALRGRAALTPTPAETNDATQPPKDDASARPAGTPVDVWRAILQRRGQPAFRKALLAAYRGRCAITGCDAADALEAAHITPYAVERNSAVTNGLLLRADIHTLFDLHQISIEPRSLEVCVAPALHSSYGSLKGKPLDVPGAPYLRPDIERLRAHHHLWKANAT